jgi:threonine dehydratase
MHAYDQPEVVIGAGTLAAEIEADAGLPDRVLVSVGGGGLIGGIAAWCGPRCRVEALEPERAPTLHAARRGRAGRRERWRRWPPMRWARSASAASPGT